MEASAAWSEEVGFEMRLERKKGLELSVGTGRTSTFSAERGAREGGLSVLGSRVGSRKESGLERKREACPRSQHEQGGGSEVSRRE